MTDRGRFKTKHYEQRYIAEIQSRPGIVSWFDRISIFGRLFHEEKEWLANMGSEYEEVMHAQAAVEEANGAKFHQG